METAFWIPPWLQPPWEQLLRQHRAGRLPHALLLTGIPGIGKQFLAEAFAAALLCQAPDDTGRACGVCEDCVLLQAHTHPDRILAPDPTEKSQEIHIESIRTLVAAESLTPHRSRWKLICIQEAHRMNAAAANALLKTLEEPTATSLFLLLTHRPGLLPATVRSRCQRLFLPTPPEAEALTWLQAQLPIEEAKPLLRLVHGAPLAALGLAKGPNRNQHDRALAGFIAVGEGRADPVQEAAAWNPIAPSVLLNWLGSWVSDLLRLAGTQCSTPVLHQAQEAALVALSRRLDPVRGHRYLRQIWEIEKTNLALLNPQLLYESLLIRWAKLLQSAP